ncbi:hypothetical protein ACER0A_002430 [Haloimpatiens sp. FM7315]|uniref:hypothetical protein n=1 Tax=Haloimpatiens sp. FM7315 TaxID=3298609 RepID=UPI00370A23F8
MIKVIKINRKKIGILLILCGLMIVLAVFQKTFDERIKFTALMQNEMKDLKEYYILNNKYSYKLPSDFETIERKFPSKEIIYHNEFYSKNNSIYGFVQLWNIDGNLYDFLIKSGEISKKQNVIDNYKLEKTQIDNREVYEITYNITDKNKNIYSCYEYFIPVDQGFVRFSFFLRKSNFKDSMPLIFKAIVKTLKTI